MTQKRDVAVVLGAALQPDGSPGPAMRRRVLHAVDLLAQGRTERLLLSGGIGKYPPAEARVMQRLALDLGVARSAITLEDKSTSTLANARNCAEIIKAKGWRSAWVVTDRYHLWRSIYLFRRFAVDAEGSHPPMPVLTDGNIRWRWYYLHLREGGAILWMLIQVSGGRQGRMS